MTDGLPVENGMLPLGLPMGPVDVQAQPPKRDKELTVEESEATAVKEWISRIKDAKNHFKDDFDEMRENMRFAAGIQWEGQTKRHYDKYVANVVGRNLNQKVASLYAKDPKAIAVRRKRMNHLVWDGKMETLEQALQTAQMTAMQGMEVPPDVMQILNDYQQGRQVDEQMDKVGQTLELLYQYNVDEQDTDFKLQMKQLVRRTETCSVGYVRIAFERTEDNSLSTIAESDSMEARATRVMNILERLKKGEIEQSSPEMDELQTLMATIQKSSVEGEKHNVQERIVFDFPPSSSIIVDPRCRTLKGFVNAEWIAQEFVKTAQEANEFFEVNVERDGKAVMYVEDSKDGRYVTVNDQQTKKPKSVVFWCVYHRKTKSHFYVMDGYESYLAHPEPVDPNVKGFWPIFALTFNETEVEPGCGVSIYPASEVSLMRSAQKEINRCRQANREHRNANTPKYFTGKGWLTKTDKENIMNALPSAVIEIEGATPDRDVNKMLAAHIPAAIDGALYETQSYQQDILLTTGAQEANLGPAPSNVTATVGTIAETSRLSTVSSNVDDLDDLLTFLARAGSEILIRELSSETVKRIVGPGAAWPDSPESKQEFLMLLFLGVKAASTGRPNRAIDLANWQQAAPILQAAGANPHFMVRETLKRLDDRLEPEEAFPLVQPQMGGSQQPQVKAGGQPKQRGKAQETPNAAQMPNNGAPQQQ